MNYDFKVDTLWKAGLSEKRLKNIFALAVLLTIYCFSEISYADSIDPSILSTNIDVGENITLRHTVTIHQAPSTSIIDVMFLFDTSTSMNQEIAAAKSGAGSILSGLSTLGNTATGVGYFSDPGAMGVYRNLTTDFNASIENINDITLELGGAGGDFPELGVQSTFEAATNASWRENSSRFIVALADATFKESEDFTIEKTSDALTDNNITFIGLNFGKMTQTSSGGIDPTVFTDTTGGKIIQSADTTEEIVNNIISSISDTFEDYSEVSISGVNSDPTILGISVNCISANIGKCEGDKASGDFDRSVTREFEFDVTYSGLMKGDTSFKTNAIADSKIIASAFTNITVASNSPIQTVPEPGTWFLLIIGLCGLGLMGQSGKKRRDSQKNKLQK